ncbi:MAG: murein hydrolase activator EnvC family protein [Pseudohongiellaceae bacterium]|jgi:septal ring factor EnvC (AmiA/AmiB activator)
MARQVLLSSLLVLSALAVAQEEGATELSRRELARLEAGIERAKEAVADLDLTRQTQLREVEQQEQQILEIQRRVASLAVESGNSGQSLRSLGAERERLETEQKSQQRWLTQYVLGAWRNGSGEFFKLLLGQPDTAGSARMLRYYRYFAAARQSRLDSHQQLLAELAATRTRIEEMSGTLGRQQEELLAQEEVLREQQSKRKALLTQVEEQLQREGRQLNNLEQQRIERQLLLEELRQAQAVAQSLQFAAARGKLPWPVSGTLTARFGERHELGDLTYQGITIAAPQGTVVKAVHAGRVVFADWFSNSGLLLIIDHGNGFMTLYAHNQELLQKAGASVAAGAAIAKVGDTGGRQQSGLYFEIRHEGAAENPVSWLKPAP